VSLCVMDRRADDADEALLSRDCGTSVVSALARPAECSFHARLLRNSELSSGAVKTMS
jgi:hypothetical protein